MDKAGPDLAWQGWNGQRTGTGGRQYMMAKRKGRIFFLEWVCERDTGVREKRWVRSWSLG